MSARLAQLEDYASGGIDRLLASDHDVRLSSDIVIAAGPIGQPTGCLVWRPAAFVHGFVCGKSLAARKIAVQMFDFAIAEGRDKPRPPRGVLFRIQPENVRMQNFAEHAVKALKEDGIIYSLPL